MKTEKVQVLKSSFCMLLTIYMAFAVCFQNCDMQMQSCQENRQPYKGGVFLRCDGRNFTDVPNVSPYNITGLDLSYNSFSKVSAGAFSQFGKLIYLDLTCSKITELDDNAFDGLFDLEILKLARNGLEMTNKSLPRNVFMPLSNLTSLDITTDEGIFDNPYLNYLFEPLKNLQILKINTLEKVCFGKGFSSLTNLQQLHIIGNFKLQSLYQTNTFEAFTNISVTRLDIVHSFYDPHSDVDYLHPMKHLDILSFQSSNVGIRTAMQLLQPLVGRNMSVLNLIGISLRSSKLSTVMDDMKITKNYTKYLTQICLKKLYLNNNKIIFIEIDAFLDGLFMNCIEYLDVSQNYLIGDARVLMFLNKFEQLNYFNLSNQFNHYKFQYQNVPNNNSVQITLKEHVIVNTYHKNIRKVGNYTNYTTLSVHLPKNLEYLDISAVGQYQSADEVHHINIQFNGSNMKVFKMANMNVLLTSYGFGLQSINLLDVSGNDLQYMRADFFDYFPNLVTLKLIHCLLQEDIMERINNIIFRNLSKLAHLDMSSNYLFHLPKIKYPQKLVKLILSNNRFQTIPVDFPKMSNLSILDLSFNFITDIDSQALAWMDTLVEKHDFQLLLKGNILSCSCNNLKFVKWLGETSVSLDNNKNFSCFAQDGSLTNTMNVILNYNTYWMTCHGPFFFMFSVSLFALLILLSTTSYFILRHPAKTKNLILRLLGMGIYPMMRNQFRYDTFFGYCEKDYRFVYRNAFDNLENRHGLRLFLWERDTIPGGNKSGDVMDAVNGSWRTVLFISRAFLADDQSYFLIKTVMYSVSILTPKRIILLFLEPVNMAELPQDLLNVVEEDDIYHYQHYLNNEGERSMWDSIAHKIRRQA